MKIQAWIYKTYLIHHVADMLRERGMVVERVDDHLFFVVGTIPNTARVWEVPGVRLYVELKNGQLPSEADIHFTASWRYLL